MYPNSALSAGQLATMAVVVVLSLAAWLIAVALAARQPRGTSAEVNTGPPEEETATTVTRLSPDERPADKTAALPGTVTAGVPAPWHDGWSDGDGTSRSTEGSRVSTGCTITWRRDERPDCPATSGRSVGLAG